MKTITTKCDGCGIELGKDGHGVYRLTHDSVAGEGIWGDNRISKPIDYCKDCFDKIYKTFPNPTHE